MYRTVKMLAIVVGVGACTWVWSDEGQHLVTPPASNGKASQSGGGMDMPMRVDSKEFKQMKQLVGVWKGTKEGSAPGEVKDEPVEVDYKLTAGGSTLQETLMPGTPHEMVTMYHDEGNKLTMTHYCMMGNTPHMVATQANAQQIHFRFIPGAGIDPVKDAHMDALTLEFKDNDHLVQKWSCHQNGKPDNNAVFILTRVKA